MELKSLIFEIPIALKKATSFSFNFKEIKFTLLYLEFYFITLEKY